MSADDVVAVLDRLDAAGIEWWSKAAGRVEAMLAEYHRVETGEWPRFLVLDDEDGRRVDLALAGAVDREDVATRGAGRIGVRDVRCLSVEFQLANAPSADAPALRERFADRRGV